MNAEQVFAIVASTKKKLQQEIDDSIVGVYTPGGDVLFENLPPMSESNLGFVYGIIDNFTTDSRFVEGAGIDYPAGTEVVVVNKGTVADPVYKFDIKTGIVKVDDELSYVSKNPLENRVTTNAIHNVSEAVNNEASARQSNDQRLSQLISALDTEIDNHAQALVQIQSSLQNKVDKIQGKGLSKNDFTDAYKAQLDNLDLTAYQPKTLVTPITVDGVIQTTVEGALGAINGKTIDMDDALSSTSENAVMNKVIKSAVDLKQDDIGLSVVNGRICVTYEEE